MLFASLTKKLHLWNDPIPAALLCPKLVSGDGTRGMEVILRIQMGQ